MSSLKNNMRELLEKDFLDDDTMLEETRTSTRYRTWEQSMSTVNAAFNGMIAFMLAKFILNDVPHTAGFFDNASEKPPTPGQLRYIAILCKRQGKTEPYEERIRTFGEAGRFIRELQEEEKYIKRSRGKPR